MRLLLIAAAFVCAAGFAPQTTCGDEFLQARAPANVNSRFAPTATTLCYSEFAVLASADTRTPLWSAEHLTREDIIRARGLKRVDRFHPEPRLPEGARAELVDYRHSGFDRGHMAPNADMPTVTAQLESFSLANMAPQTPALNRGLWEEIESEARSMAMRDGEIYIVSGPMFDAAPKTLNGRVDVPAAFYKAIYNPRTGKAGAYVAWNDTEEPRVKTVSIATLRTALGFDPFPALSEDVKREAPELPPPLNKPVS